MNIAAAPRTSGKYVRKPKAPRYNAFQLYDNRADPHQLVNLCGRQETAAIELKLREPVTRPDVRSR